MNIAAAQYSRRFCLTQKLAETSHLALFDSQLFKMKYIFRLNYTCTKLSDRIASQLAFPFEPPFLFLRTTY